MPNDAHTKTTPTIRFEAETEAGIRARIDDVLRSHGIYDSVPADTLFDLVANVATEAAKAGYERGVDKFIGPVDDAHPACVGTLDLRTLAEECLSNIDLTCEACDSPRNIDGLAGVFARLMNVRVGMVAHMLGEEHTRLARVATTFPTLADDVRRQCDVIRWCVKLIEGGMLPASAIDADTVAR